MTAKQVGSRHGGRVVILRVDALRAARDDIPFYQGNENTWLAERIPAAYLSVLEQGTEECSTCIL